jgi:hypothetical protein
MVVVAANKEWLTKLMATEQKRADAAGMNLIEYMSQVNGGILKNTIAKMLRHAKAHATFCPNDCAFQKSLDELKKKYHTV